MSKYVRVQYDMTVRQVHVSVHEISRLVGCIQVLLVAGRSPQMRGQPGLPEPDVSTNMTMTRHSRHVGPHRLCVTAHVRRVKGRLRVFMNTDMLRAKLLTQKTAPAEVPELFDELA